MNRRSFLAGTSLLAAGAIVPRRAEARAAGEEKYTPPPPVKGGKRLLAEPVLQCPSPWSMGVAWAVSGLANGAVEGGELRLAVHNVSTNEIVATHTFKPRV